MHLLSLNIIIRISRWVLASASWVVTSASASWVVASASWGCGLVNIPATSSVERLQLLGTKSSMMLRDTAISIVIFSFCLHTCFPFNFRHAFRRIWTQSYFTIELYYIWMMSLPFQSRLVYIHNIIQSCIIVLNFFPFIYAQVKTDHIRFLRIFLIHAIK